MKSAIETLLHECQDLWLDCKTYSCSLSYHPSFYSDRMIAIKTFWNHFGVILTPPAYFIRMMLHTK